MPRIELTRRLNKHTTVKVVADNQLELIENMSFFESLPDTCPRCGDETYLSHREYDGNDYYELRCRGTVENVEHKASIGQHKDSRSLFYKEGQNWLTLEELRNGKKHVPEGGRQQQNPNQDIGQMREQANRGKPEPQGTGSVPDWVNHGPPPNDPRFS